MKTQKVNREAVRKVLVLMLLANAAPGEDNVSALLPKLTNLLRSGRVSA